MNLSIRQETKKDYPQVEALVERAFRTLDISDHNEHQLVASLRKSKAFVPELSLVAELDGTLVGHILLTKAHVVNDSGTEHETLGLAPVSVEPEFQKKGVGCQLIEASHNRARELGFQSIILVGHPDYYPRFGYKKASSWGIKTPFEAPDEAVMAIELREGALNDVSGVLSYPPEFGLG